MIYQVWEWLINVIEAFLFLVLINKKCNKREMKDNIKWQCMFIVTKAFCITILNVFKISTILTVLMCLLLNIIFVNIFFKVSIYVGIFWSVLYSFFTLTADAITVLIPTSFFKMNLNELLITGSMRGLFTIIYILLVTFFVIISLGFGHKTFRLGFFEKITFLLMAFICIFIEQLTLIALLKVTVYEVDYQLQLLMYIFFLILFLFIILIVYVYKLGVEKENNIKLVEENTIAQMEIKQYEQVMVSVKELRVFKHDMRNHMEIVGSYIQNREYERASEYINNMYVQLEHSHHIVSTGNLPMDCILTLKFVLANSYNIKLNYKVFLPKQMYISDIDVCSLLGNLMDNAIENCIKIEEIEQREIVLEIKPYKNMLFLKLENTFDGNFKVNKLGAFISTKKEFDHGIGLKRVEDIVKKYEGFWDAQVIQNRFIVSIMLSVIEKEE